MKTFGLVLFFVVSVGLFAQSSPVKQVSRKNADLDTALLLYGELSGRTLLRHPSLVGEGFILKSATTTNRNEILQGIEATLAEKEIVLIPDGKKFILVAPQSQRSQLVPRSGKIPDSDKKPYPKGAMMFHNATITQVMAIYADLLGKKIDQTQSGYLSTNTLITFIMTTELSKDECLYALDTLIGWRGLKLIPSGNETLKPVPVSLDPKN